MTVEKFPITFSYKSKRIMSRIMCHFTDEFPQFASILIIALKQLYGLNLK